MKKETIQVNVKMLDEERDVVQIKVPAKKIEAIRKENSNYRLIPAQDVTIIALNHFLYDLKHRKSDLPDQFSMEKKKEP